MEFQDIARKFGTAEEDIHVHENLSWVQFKRLKAKIENMSLDAGENKEETLFMVYFTGHGVQKKWTYAVCDDEEDGREIFHLHESIEAISDNSFCFFIVILDCCRDDLPPIPITHIEREKTTFVEGG